MCKFSSKSGWVPFQISFFLGDLTRNDPACVLVQSGLEGGIYRRYLPVNTGMDYTPKSGVYGIYWHL